MTRPLEVKVASLLLVGAALAFVGLGVARGDSGALTFPLLLGVIGVLAGASVFAGKFATPVLVFAGLAAVAHAAIALSPVPLWIRIGSGVLAAAHVYAAVLVLTRPARVFMGKVTGDQS
ncbi:hypothetical protein JOD54_005914 [Actinokineospora baliensis]|uniref:hypothetical protein n=1 Tax=Actinokineospora baliensis TaxID=547056 RepID=UPI001957F333|nr:hypothetical protein [Actinokineospora baliensis]MBM7775710.1 hypothetical protein [Actinokineospora baliensis]